MKMIDFAELVTTCILLEGSLGKRSIDLPEAPG